MSTTTTRGMRPSVGNEKRYTAIEVDGHRRRFRDQVTLQADVLALLDRDGALAKKRIIMELHTAQAAIDTALSGLEEAGKVERFRTRSARGRSDEYWCIAGTSPGTASRATPESGRYRASDILAAMQSHAAHLMHAGGAQR